MRFQCWQQQSDGQKKKPNPMKRLGPDFPLFRSVHELQDVDDPKVVVSTRPDKGSKKRLQLACFRSAINTNRNKSETHKTNCPRWKDEPFNFIIGCLLARTTIVLRGDGGGERFILVADGCVRYTITRRARWDDANQQAVVGALIFFQELNTEQTTSESC